MYINEIDTFFFIEAQEMLENSALLLIEAEKEGRIADVLNEVFRTFHSIKGGAQTLHIDLPGELAHNLENLLDVMRMGRGVEDPNSVNIIFSSIDLLQEGLSLYNKQGHANELKERYRLLITEVNEYLELLNNATSLEDENIMITGEKSNCNEYEQAKTCEDISKDGDTIIFDELPKAADGVSKKISRINVQRLHKLNRLLYILCIIDYKASMPQVSQFLTLQRIKELGTVFFNSIDMESHNTLGSERNSYLFSSVLLTDKSDTEIKRECNTADIHAIHITNLSLNTFGITDIPHIAIEDFIMKIVRIINCVRHDDMNEQSKFKKHLRSLKTWGEHFITNYYCFAGGINEWQKKIELINQIKDIHSSALNVESKRTFEYLLRDLWDSMYLSLNNRTYFYTLVSEHQPSSIEFEGELRDILKTDKMRFLFLDLSKMNHLDWDDVEVLTNYFYILHDRKIELLLYAKEPQMSSHKKSLCDITGIIPLFVVYDTPFSAFYKIVEDKGL